jgi:hypothetical protein
MRLDDDAQSRTSHRSRRSHTSRLTSRPPLERNHTDDPRSSRHRFEDDLAGASEGGRELARRNSEQVARSFPPVQRSQSLPYVDMDLAYGDVPPPLPETRYDDGEIKEKASKITMLLDEANCLQYSATTMIENLQKNPEALAAVSLTLAEISALISKMGPGVLPILKGSFPAVAALLLSPQFMIAGGVAVGVTIVALGGYKIMRKIQNQEVPQMLEGGPVQMPANPQGLPTRSLVEEPYELDELETRELSRIDLWRRGIADVEASASGCSVDGEFITPQASRHLVAEGVLDEDDLKSRRSMRLRDDGERRSKSHRAKSEHSSYSAARSEARSDARSERSSHTSKTHKTSDTRRTKTIKEGSLAGSSSGRKKEKEPSGLRMLFRSRTAAY